MSATLTLQNYLKKYSSINTKFIDDFFNLYNEKTTDSDFVININSIATWLLIRKDALKRTLSENYRENIDYKITINKSITKGRPSEIIMLSPDCFKRLCMMTKSTKGEEVRSYYIDLEKHIDKYKDNIINDLRKKINILESDIKPSNIPKEYGVIYILKTDSTTDFKDIYKVGSTEDFKARLLSHQSSHLHNVKVEYVYKTSDYKNVEQCLKSVLRTKQYRKRKEFYEIDLNILKDVITKCDEAISLVKKPIATKKQSGGSEFNYYLYLHKIISS